MRWITGSALAAIFVSGGLLSAFLYGSNLTGAPDVPVARRPEPQPARNVLRPEDVARLRAEIARLGAQAEKTRQTVGQLLGAQRRWELASETQRERETLNPWELARIEVEKTAFLLVDFADERATGAEGEFPADAYRRVIELFPDTNAARKARGKLDQSLIREGDL